MPQQLFLLPWQAARLAFLATEPVTTVAASAAMATEPAAKEAVSAAMVT